MIPPRLRALFACLLLAAAARAESRRTVFFSGTTFARGDLEIEDLFRDALKATGRLELISRRSRADLIASLAVSRSRRGVELNLDVVSQAGVAVAHLREVVGPGESLVDAALHMAAQVAGEPAPPIRSAPVAAAPASPPRVEESRPVRDWRSPYDSRQKRLDFLLGVELGAGPWSADPSKIVGGSDTGFDFTRYAPAFTSGIDGRWHPDLALRAGLMFLGAGSFELTWSASRWSGSGSATLIGARLTAWIFPAFWRDRWFDLGLQFGAGYALLAGSGYDMTGGYWNLGLAAEYPLNHWLGVTGYWRLFAPFLKHFYIDYQSGLSEPTSGVTFTWNTFGVGLCFHPAIGW
jgi:hypothetical protein